ncbi:hypothetical protein SynMEDNS5_01247 [Synechococcus sp. MEDNS5]|uniref:DUF4178 domain-containing protein n=1 Tax=Synechococcus sp. MEDNS5 TaxID=1442554 RepID=UPI001648FBDE|nr:DUF4178 domain-containing protein [Synechococcus sp. MEDNS5]QNJ05971.1 hypothetical protein SynMEDNS5_01247 [Synechococcus sp. MEDNS5]|tara:strand:+ start:583 stop:1188 length:606 start_codon:yes stop_codon:yes gene_type:complete
MEFFIFLFVAFALLLWLFSRYSMSRWHRPPVGSMPQQRTLFNLRVGDVVQRESRDWIVENTLVFDQKGFQWQEYYLRDGAEGVWLVVVDDDRIELSWMHQVPPEEVSVVFPLRDELVYQGVRYRLSEKGIANYRKTSRGSQQGGPCRFHDYVAQSDRVLSVEIYSASELLADDGEIELCVGVRITPESLTLLPGDGRSVYA